MSAPRRLVPALFRAYSSIGARAGEKVVPVSNAHRTSQGVIEVRCSGFCSARERGGGGDGPPHLLRL